MIDIELPTKITEIIGIISALAVGGAIIHRLIKHIHVGIEIIKIELGNIKASIHKMEKRIEKVEEKVDHNEKSTQLSLIKTNESIVDIKLSTGKLESSFSFIKDGMQCQKREGCRE